ncbi:ABC-type transporter, integral membrane subunit, partial [Desulfovibrio sp. X2]
PRSTLFPYTTLFRSIGINLLDWLVYGPWKDPASFGFPMTPPYPAGATFPVLPGTKLHLGILVCVLAGVAVWLWLTKTRLGYEVKAAGSGPMASRYARMNYGFLVCLVMAACGVLAGFSGLIEAAATLGKLQPSIISGYGYTAIVVAWLARLNPLAIGLAAFLLAGLRVGVENIQLSLQVPASFGGIMEGLILLTVLAGQFVGHFRFRLERSGHGEREAEAGGKEAA